MPRQIFICGGPECGKTRLAQELACKHGILDVLSTDSLITLGWSEASAEAARWISERDGQDIIVEGVAVPRTLRKYMAQNPGKRFEPGTQIYVLNQPYVPQTKHQQAMSKGMHTVLREIRAELVRRGATFEQHNSDTDNNSNV